MTLYKQISLLVSLLLLLLLGGVLGINFFKLKNSIEDQLYIQARNSAYSLSIALSTIQNDHQKVKEVIDTVFEHGAYELIEYEDQERLPVYRKQKVESRLEVPMWFTHLCNIHTVPVENQVKDNGQILGAVLVISDKEVAYQQLYDLFKYLLYLFIFFALLGHLFLHFVLRILLRSLKSIQQQAEEVNHNRFIIQKDLPSTVELRDVMIAMNSMIKRVKDLYERSSEAMKKYQDSLYYDPLTNLFNRRYFQVKLPEYLLANDDRSHGALLLIRMNGVPFGNKKIGHKKMDDLFIQFSSILQKLCNEGREPILCRLNGTEFAIVLPAYHKLAATELAQNIIKAFLVLADKFGLRENLYLSIGICEYARKDQVRDLLSCADTALFEASRHHENYVVAYGRDKEKSVINNANKTELRDIVVKALKEERLQPQFDPVVDLKTHQEIFYTLTFDISYDTHMLKFSDYAQMISDLGMEYDLMKFELEYMKKHHFKQHTIAFPLMVEMLHESEKLFYFEQSVKEIAKNMRGSLFVEISEYDLLALDPIVAERLSKALRQHGVRIGITNFSGEKADYSYLKYTAPAYVKIHESLYLNIGSVSQNALHTLLGSLDIQLIVVDVNEENISRLENRSIRYVMFS